MSIGNGMIAMYSEPADRESYKHLPILSFPVLFVVLVLTVGLLYCIFWKRR